MGIAFSWIPYWPGRGAAAMVEGGAKKKTRKQRDTHVLHAIKLDKLTNNEYFVALHMAVQPFVDQSRNLREHKSVITLRFGSTKFVNGEAESNVAEGEQMFSCADLSSVIHTLEHQPLSWKAPFDQQADGFLEFDNSSDIRLRFVYAVKKLLRSVSTTFANPGAVSTAEKVHVSKAKLQSSGWQVEANTDDSKVIAVYGGSANLWLEIMNSEEDAPIPLSCLTDRSIAENILKFHPATEKNEFWSVPIQRGFYSTQSASY
jgi:hypothetical protein